MGIVIKCLVWHQKIFRNFKIKEANITQKIISYYNSNASQFHVGESSNQKYIHSFLSWYVLSVYSISSIESHMLQSPEGSIYQLEKFLSIYLVFSLLLFLPHFSVHGVLFETWQIISRHNVVVVSCCDDSYARFRQQHLVSTYCMLDGQCLRLSPCFPPPLSCPSMRLRGL